MKPKLYDKTLKCLCFFLAFSWLTTVTGQTTHEVTVSNNKFDPSELTIAVGDIVKWTNTEGSHSVDGTTETFPSNPASFGNEVGTEGWTYSFTFNTEGVHDYRCGVHTATMTGKITVGTSTGIDDVVSATNLKQAYPNPVSDVLYVPVKDNSGFENKFVVRIYNLNGKMVTQNSSDYMSKLDINVESLKNGVYIYQVSQNEKIIQSEKFVVK